MSERNTLHRLIVATVFSVPVMLITMIEALHFTGWQWLVLVLSLPVVTWCAWPFHRGAVGNLRHGAFTMDTLVSMGVTAATLWSLWALLFGGASDAGGLGAPALSAATRPHTYFEGATMVTTFLLAGRYAEARSKRIATSSLRALLDLGAKTATLVTDGPQGPIETQVDVKTLKVGDKFRVRPGEKVATDGRIVSGRSAIDKSLLTGESMPESVAPGDFVAGATVNTSGTLLVEATRVGEETMLSQIGRMVQDAQAGKAPVQRLADSIAGWFVPAVIGLSVLTLIGWLIWGPSTQTAVTAAVAVLVVACPCALGLATPMALLVGSSRASKQGILLRGPQVLEAARQLDTVVFDKTGTLTEGKLQVTDVAPQDNISHEQLLSAAAFAEDSSEHPLATTIVAAARTAGASWGQPTDFENVPGMGVIALAEGGQVTLVGRPSWVAERAGVQVPIAGEGTQVAVCTATLPDGAPSAASAGTEGATSSIQATEQAGTGATSGANDDQTYEIDIAGMSCASCANRVEKMLNRLDGASAEVNFVTKKARVKAPAGFESALEGAVTKAGYTPVATNLVRVRSAAEITADQPQRKGSSLVELLNDISDVRLLGVIGLQDRVKESARQAVADLRQMGVSPVLLTGDAEAPARAAARELGIERVIAQALPDQKRDAVKQLQDEGKTTAMVGDGVNDAAALAQAGVRGLGIAMGSGTDLAKEAADITIVNSDPRSVVEAIRISHATLRGIKQNLGWAFGYNLIALPLAMAGLLNPMIASAFMAFSSVAVVLNSLRLRKA